MIATPMTENPHGADDIAAAFGLAPNPDRVAGIGGRLSQLAAERGDQEALVVGDDRRTFREIDDHARRMATVLRAHGVAQGSPVAIEYENVGDVLVAGFAAWKLGASVAHLSPRLAEQERVALLEVIDPAVTICARPRPGAIPVGELVAAAASAPAVEVADVATDPWKMSPSGGSTGRPKIIVSTGDRGPLDGRAARLFGIRPGDRVLVPTACYHGGPFGWGHIGLLGGATLVLLERFDARAMLETIERERVNFVYTVPTMLHRVDAIPDDELASYDLSSLRLLFHTSAPCPKWLKERTIQRFGATRVWEYYGASEMPGGLVRGDEWLEHRGTVGRAFPGTDVRVCDPETGDLLPHGEIGELFVRPAGGVRFAYRGATEKVRDGYASVGDLGWTDADGYIYLADRRNDMIISGGSNVYPAEVEAALLRHPTVGDAGVVGLEDPEWGQEIVAAVQPGEEGAPPDPADLIEHCRSLLSSYKVPRRIVVVDDIGREPSGKLRRSDLRRFFESPAAV